LQVVSSLVGRLAEEYLVLLPEAIPFLAELMEDTSHAVEARTQELVAQLEAIAGESLDPYMKA
jgi:U3 small nucleolar RNA-associated protein 10